MNDKFDLFVSERLFLNTFARFIKTFSKGGGRRKRIERLITTYMNTESDGKLPLSAVRRLAKQYTRPDAATFERFKKSFLLSDHPQNLDRFSVTFEDVMKLVDPDTE